MGATIDERIVEMKFDNKEFEQNAQTSMKTLQELDKSLELSDGTMGLKNLASAAGSVSFEALGNAVEAVTSKFSHFQEIASGALREIGSRLADTALEIGNALAIEPVTTGLNEYEEKIDNVQTTMLNTGASVEEVDSALEVLNKYADKTIFKFSDMTGAMASFTTAGISDLDVVTTMVEGIGNAAGSAGLKAEQASSVYYMLSQAMSQGSMQLYQWRTLERTNFASIKFKENLLETAAALGKIEKNADGSYTAMNEKGKEIVLTAENMRTTLTDTGWMDKEVMTSIMARYASSEASIALGLEDISEEAFHAAQDIKTFSQMYDTLKEAAQSGWSETWGIVIGNFEEAKQLWGSVNSVISGFLDANSQARNDMLREWKDLGGRTAILDGIRIAFENITAVLKPLKTAFENVFPKKTGQDLYEMSVNFKKLMESLKPTEIEIQKLGTLFHKFFVTLKTIGESVSKIGTAIKEAFTEIFPKKNNDLKIIESLYQMFLKLDNAFKISDTTLDKVKRTFKGVFALFDIGVQLAKALWNALSPIFEKLFLKAVPKANGGLLAITATIGDWIVKLDELIKEHNVFGFVLDKIGNIISKVIDFFAGISKSVSDAVGSIKIGSASLSEIIDANNSFEIVLSKVTNAMRAAYEFLSKYFNKALEKMSNLIENIKPKLIDIKNKISELFNSDNDLGINASLTDGNSTLSKFINMLNNAKNAFVTIWDATKPYRDMFKEMAGKVFDKIGEGLAWLQENFKQIATTLGIGSLAGMTFVDVMKALFKINKAEDNIGSIWTSIANFFKNIQNMPAFINQIFANTATGIKGFFEDIDKQFKTMQVETLTKALKKFAEAILILAVGMLILTKIPTDRIKEISVVMAGLISAMGGMLFAINGANNLGGKGSKSGNGFLEAFTGSTTATQILKFAASIFILSIAMKKIADLDGEQIRNSLIGLGVAMLELFIFAKLMSKNEKDLLADAAAMFVLAKGMKQFAKAIIVFGEMSPEQMTVAMFGVATAIAALYALTKIDSNDIMKTASSMVIVGAALLLMSGAMKLMGSLNIAEMGIAILGLASVIGAFVGMSQLVKSDDIIKAAAALAIAGGAMIVMGLALKLMGSLNIGEMGIAILGLASVMGAFIAMSHLANEKEILKLSVALLIVGAAMAVFAVSMMAFKAVNWGEILKAVTIMVAALALLGIAAYLFDADAMMKVAGAFAILGVGMLAVGAGVLLLSAGLAALAVSGLAGLTALALGLREILALIPYFFEKLGEGILVLITFIGDAAPAIIEAVVKIVGAIIDGLIELVPKFFELVKTVILGICDVLLECGPKLIETAVTLILSLLRTIAEHIKEFAELGIKIIVGLMEGLAEGLPDLINAGFDVIIAFINGLADAMDEKMPLVLEAVWNLVVAIGETLWKVIQKGVDIAKQLGEKIGEKLSEFKEKFKEKAKQLIDKIISGIKEKISTAVQAIRDLGQKMRDKIDEFKEKFKEAARNIILGFINGIKEKVQDAIDSIKEFGGKIKDKFCDIFGINSPSKVFKEYGMYMDEGLAIGLKKYAGQVVDATEDVGQSSLDAMRETVAAASDILEGDDYQPTITPVLDLSNIQNGSSLVNGMFDNQRIGVTATGYNNYANAVAGSNTSMSDDISNSFGKFIPTIIDAINKVAESGQDVRVQIEADPDRMYRVMRVQNQKFFKSTGQNGMVI